MRDLRNNLDVVSTLAPAARTATINGAGVDLQNYEGAMLVFLVGAITDGTHVPSLQESADNVSYAAVAAADLEGTLVNLTAASVQRVGYKGTRRWVRAVSTVTGATTGGVYGALVVRGYPRHMPLP